MSDLGIEDHRVLVRQLQATVISMHSSSKDKVASEESTIAAYLLKRYDNQGNYVNGGHHVEVDARLGWQGSSRLGEGAYGNVEKSTWFGLPCAKKVQRLGEKEDGDKTFKKEVAILASANHPNVVKFICCGRKLEKHKCFIAMELLDTSLDALIKEKSNGGTKTPFPIQVAMDMYSFGIMCATIISGKQPFEGNYHDLPTRLRSGERPCVPDHCPKALVSLLKECWSLDQT